jgi:hypothetical protein
MAAIETSQTPFPVNEAARATLCALATGERVDPMLRRLLTDALASEDRSDRPRDPSALVSDAARSATEWIGATSEKRELVLRQLLTLADALPPQPKFGPSLPDKVSSVHGALAKARIPHAFGGALAVGYYGEPRATGDIDVNVFVSVDAWPGIKESLASLEIDIGIDDREVTRYDELQLDWGSTPVHLFFSCDRLHEQMRQAVRKVPFNRGAIPLIAAEHLVVRKAILDRPKDWHDVEQILVATSPLNLKEIEDWLQRLAGKDDPRVAKLSQVKTSLSLA